MELMTKLNGTIEKVTKNEVIHAEMNIFAKCARQGISTDGAVLFVTLSPCFECSKLIIQGGIKEVIYLDEYRITDAIEFLRKANVKVTKYEEC